MDLLAVLRQRLIQDPPEKFTDTDRVIAAVIVPFFERNGEWHLLFTHRSDNLQYHRSEISFPGGAMESLDPDLLTTALRELKEEVDVPSDRVEILGRLSHWRTVSSSFLVVPYVGYLIPPATFRANPSEVAEILEVPLIELKDPSIFKQEDRVIDQKVHPIYYYQWRSHTIWGLTGRIVKTVLDLLQ